MYIPPLPGLNTVSATSQVVTIDPSTAAEWLTHNTHNRAISDQVVKQYAADMTSGRWSFNGQSIIFADDGTLLDGQHRLTAQVRAGIPCTWLVVTGMPAESQRRIDLGRVRSVANHFQIEGRSHTALVASIARLDLIDKGNIAPSKVAVSEHVESDYPALEAAAQWGQRLRENLNCAPTIVGLAYYRLAMVDQEAAVEFFSRLCDGVGLPEGSPILVARKVFSRRNHISSVYDRLAAFRFLLRVWNYWREGRSCKSITAPSKAVTPR